MFGLESLEELLFNQVYIITCTNTHLFLLLFCLKNEGTFEKLLKLRGGKMPPPPSNPLKKNPTSITNEVYNLVIHLFFSLTSKRVWSKVTYLHRF